MVTIGSHVRGCLPQLLPPEAMVWLRCCGGYKHRGFQHSPSTCTMPQQEQLDFLNLFHLCFLISVSNEQSASSLEVLKNHWFRGLDLNFVRLFMIRPLSTNFASYLTAPSAPVTFKQDRLPEQPFAFLASIMLFPLPYYITPACLHAGANSLFP